MPLINNIHYTKSELLKKCGKIDQVAGYKRYIFSEGKAKGVEAVDINNGNGLKFTVLLDRNMDIAFADFRGVNFSYITKNGIVAPQYYDKDENEWLRSFIGGLLTTCGISNAGAASVDMGEKLGLHGRISNTPVDNVCCKSYWEEDEFFIEVSGQSHETKFFGEYLTLHRSIKVKAGENRILLHDRIENEGYRSTPIMMIYHYNLGFPLVDEGGEIYINSDKWIPTSLESEKRMQDQFKVTSCEANAIENVYFHEFLENKKTGLAMLLNKKLMNNGIGVYIKFDLKELPYLNLWKMMGEGEYVIGLEPSNCMTLGRDKERKRGALRYIEAGEVKDFKMEIGIIENIENIDIKELEKLVNENEIQG